MPEILEQFDRFCLKRFTGQDLKTKKHPDSIHINVYKKARTRCVKGQRRSKYFFKTSRGKTGFTYLVSEKKLQKTIDRLPSKHGIVRELVIKYDKLVKASDPNFNARVVCKSKIDIVKLTTKEICVVSESSTVCGVPFWKWLNMAKEGNQPRGDCHCEHNHDFLLNPYKVLHPTAAAIKRAPETQHKAYPSCHRQERRSPKPFVPEQNTSQPLPAAVLEERSSFTDDSGGSSLYSRGRVWDFLPGVASDTSVEPEFTATSEPAVVTDLVLPQDSLLRLSLLFAAYKGMNPGTLSGHEPPIFSAANPAFHAPPEPNTILSQDTLLRLWLVLTAYHDMEMSLGLAFACDMGALSDAQTHVCGHAEPCASPSPDPTLSTEAWLRLWLLFSAYSGMEATPDAVAGTGAEACPGAQTVDATGSEPHVLLRSNAVPSQDSLLRLWILLAAYNGIEANLGIAGGPSPGASSDAHSDVGRIAEPHVSSQPDPAPSLDALQRLWVLLSAYHSWARNTGGTAEFATDPLLDSQTNGISVAEPHLVGSDSYAYDLLAVGAQLDPAPSGDPDLDLDTDSDLDEFYDVEEYRSSQSAEGGEGMENYEGPLSESALTDAVVHPIVPVAAEPSVRGLPSLVATQPTRSEASVRTPLGNSVGSPSVRRAQLHVVPGSGAKNSHDDGDGLPSDLGQHDGSGLDDNRQRPSLL